MESFEDLFNRLTVAHKAGVKCLNSLESDDYISHINVLTNLLFELDGYYIELVPDLMFQWFPKSSEDAVQISRIGFSVGFLVRRLQDAQQAKDRILFQ